MTNTLAQGNAFRDRVFALLQLVPSIYNLDREKPIEHQAVDIYYEERTSFGTAKVACECKDYGTPLTRGIIETKIYPKYAPLLVNRAVDAVRIITPIPVAVDAQRYLESIHFKLTPVDQLETSIMDFSAYLGAMISQYSDEGLDKYYLPATLEESGGGTQQDEDAERYLTSWMQGDSNTRPVAILATYGMGKSSFARRLAFVQAERHRSDQVTRIPIFIPLGDISTEQDIRGLITKHLAAQHRVHNFHYELFRELNRRGRFVLIFDGFDEMKHTMSFDDLRFNFSEINRLVEGKSRVVLLGRPTVFHDDHERQYALHGMRENQRRIADAVDYVELELREFDDKRSLQMMRAYGAYAIARSNDTGIECVSSAILEERLADIRKDEEMALLSHRPVQAKMLIDLAIDPLVEWRRFSRYELYEQFVVQFLEREAKKVARRRFTQKQRETFQRELAWWMWKTDHTGGFEMRALSRDLYRRHCQRADDAEGVARDLITGTILDLKPLDRYYFRHRSYLEFLVAQHICTAEWNPATLRAVSDTLTAEVVGFIKESPNHDALKTLHTFVNDIDGAISRPFIELLGYHVRRFSSTTTLRETASARDVFIYWSSLGDLPPREIILRFSKATPALVHRETRVAAITCMMITAYASDNFAPSRGQAMRSEGIAALLADTEEEMRRLLDSQDFRRKKALHPDALSMRLLAASMCRASGSPSQPALAFDGAAFFDAAAELLAGSVSLGEWGLIDIDLGCTYSFAELARVNPKLALTRPLGSLVQSFFSHFADPSTLVRVTKGSATPSSPRAVLRLSSRRQHDDE